MRWYVGEKAEPFGRVTTESGRRPCINARAGARSMPSWRTKAAGNEDIRQSSRGSRNGKNVRTAAWLREVDIWLILWVPYSKPKGSSGDSRRFAGSLACRECSACNAVRELITVRDGIT